MILYTAEMDLPAERLDAFDTWYAGRHAPDLYQAGFDACTSYRAVQGGMHVLNLYQLPGWDVFEHPAYRNIAAKDPYGGPSMAGAAGKANTPYQCRVSYPAAPAGEQRRIDADWLSVFRFDAPPDTEDAIADCLRDGEEAGLMGLGARRLHLARRERPHPTAPSTRPRCVLVIEWPERPPEGGAVPQFLLHDVAGRLSDTSSFMGYRVYPWPDRAPPR